jgi:hypothetical protein
LKEKNAAKIALDELIIEMKKTHITASALATMHPEQRELMLIHQGSFHGYACNVCGNRFLDTNAPKGISLSGVLNFYREQREKHFTAHVCRREYEHPAGF